MTIVVVLVWIAALYRIRVTLGSGPITLWRSSFTCAVIFVAVNATGFVYHAAVDAWIPNVASLVWHVAAVGAAGCGAVYLLTLTRPEPPRLPVRIAFGSAAAVAATELALWLTAPNRGREWEDIPQAATSAQILVYYLVFYAYLAALLPTTSVMCCRLAMRRDSTARSARAGLFVMALATGLTGVVIAVNGYRIVGSRLGFGEARALRTFGDTAPSLATGGIAVGALIFLVGPGLGDRFDAWRTLRALAPLHAALTANHPGVRIAGTGPNRVVRSERMVIEIHDALRQMSMSPPAAGDDPYVSVVRAIHEGGRRPGGVAANIVLPVARTRAQEHRVLFDLARTYRQAPVPPQGPAPVSSPSNA